MYTFFSIIVDGAAYGMILFMIAVGLSITMGLMRVINLAHGSFAVLGGVFCHLLIVRLGVPFLPATILSVVAVVLVAVPIERVLYRHVYGLGELEQVLATIGLTFIVIASINLLLGSSLISVPLPSAMQGSVDLGFKVVPVHRLYVIAVGLTCVVALFALVEKTRFGIYLRAAVDNQKTAAALGLDTSLLFALTFALGAGLAALGGVMGAELLPIEAFYPLRYLVLVLVVVSVGGMGSIAGLFFAALALGILDTALKYLVPDMGTIAFYVAFMVFLVTRPYGLLGRA